ncbi:MAG: ABC transporter permease, partial [Rubrobacteraceae bacterium]
MILGFSIVAPNDFPTFGNLVNIVNQVALTAIISAGLTVVLIVGELDLSIGYGASLAGVLVTGLMVRQGLSIPIAIILVVLLGAVVGLINSLIVTKARVNSVVATLGVGTLLIGFNYAYSSGQPISAGVSNAFFMISLGSILGIPYT